MHTTLNINNYKHVIWDWNGTLLNDIDLVINAVNATLTSRDMTPITKEKYLQLFDFPVIAFYEQLGFDYSKESFDDHSTEYHVAYDKGWRDCQLAHGVDKLLNYSKANNISQSILSASPQWMLDACVDHFNLAHYFNTLVGQDNDNAHGKIETGIAWVKQCDIHPKEMIFIGDTVHDYEVAQALGTDCVLVTTGHHPYEKLKKCDTMIVDSVEALL